MIKKIIKNILNVSFIKNFYIRIIWSQNGKNFEIIYNFISKVFFNSKNSIKYSEGLFLVKEKEVSDWFFSIPARGLFYLKGLKERSKKLHKQYLINEINFKDGEVVIDCGANAGDFYLNFTNRIQYIAVEPSDEYYKILTKNIKNQTLIKKCLYKFESDNLKFYLDDKNADSSLIPIKNYSKIITVKAITLDGLIDKIEKNIKLIKLEAEGAEIEILEGLKKNLSKVEYITIDCSFERGVEQQSTFVECNNYLMKNNFELINFDIKNRIIMLYKNINN